MAKATEKRTTAVTITLRNNIIEKVDEEAQNMGTTRSAFVAMCVNQYFKHEEALQLVQKASDLYEQVRQMADSQQVTLFE